MYFNPDTLAFVDGEFVKADQAHISTYAQSLHYGYAVFEGIRSYATPAGTQIFKAQEHYERLHYSAKAVGLSLSYLVEEMTDITYRLLELDNLADAYIRPLVYVGTPNMTLKHAATSNLLIAVWDWGKYLGDQCLRLSISPYQRPNPNAVPTEAKVSGQYVNSIIANSEAKGRGYDEALLLDMNGFVAEGPGANFFFEKNSELFTAPTGSILRGITRNTIIDLAREAGIKVTEKIFTPAEPKGNTGAFFTGTAAEVVGIASIDELVFSTPFPDTRGPAGRAVPGAGNRRIDSPQPKLRSESLTAIIKYQRCRDATLRVSRQNDPPRTSQTKQPQQRRDAKCHVSTSFSVRISIL